MDKAFGLELENQILSSNNDCGDINVLDELCSHNRNSTCIRNCSESHQNVCKTNLGYVMNRNPG